MRTADSNRFSSTDQSGRNDAPGDRDRSAGADDRGICPADFGRDPTRPFGVTREAAISLATLFESASNLARRLPDRTEVLNLCDDRVRFCSLLLAAWQRSQRCLLPPSAKASVLLEMLQQNPDAYAATDHELDGIVDVFRVDSPAADTGCDVKLPSPPDPAVISFTSGSTGRPKACPHGFETFRRSAAMALDALGLNGQQATVVSTTPPQHMFGLETSVFWPLFSALSVHAGRPFFPEDIRRVLNASDEPCILATTPTHLSAMVRSGVDWPKPAAIISSTAPLHRELADAVAERFGVAPIELYGSTETLSFAWRRPTQEEDWHTYAGVELEPLADGTCRLSAPHLPSPLILDDDLTPTSPGRFRLQGRARDLVKIAGKRGSLAELTQRLQAIGGIRDAAAYCYQDSRGERRIGAVVVGECDRTNILAILRTQLDDVFAPRRLHFVDAIPRNETGKLVADDWAELLKTLSIR